jgi:hypothetical protein
LKFKSSLSLWFYRYFGLIVASGILVFQAVQVLVVPDVIEGQVGKQTFALEMIRSFSENHVVKGWFPERHFVELHHEGVVPWAEEFPIYSFTAGMISKFTGDIDRSARILSLLGWCLFLFACRRWLFIPDTPQNQLSLFSKNIWMVLVGSASILQVYGRSVMPDGWMLALGVLSIVLWEEGRLVGSRVSILFAALAKYYAAFTAVALAWTELRRRRYVSAFLYGCMCIPAVAYIAYFLYLKIPNPISEYRDVNGHGHMTASYYLLNFHFYLRLITWVFVKLTSPLGGFLALLGVVCARAQMIRLPRWLMPLFFAQIGFAILFAPSFFVHDYYALGFLPVLMAGWMLLLRFFEMKMREGKARKLLMLGLAAVFLVWNTISATSITTRADSFLEAEARIRQCLPKWNADDYSIFLVDRSAPVLPHRLRMKAWILGLPQLELESGRKLLKLRVEDSRTRAIVIWIREPFFPPWRPGSDYKVVCDLPTAGDQVMSEASRLMVYRR